MQFRIFCATVVCLLLLLPQSANADALKDAEKLQAEGKWDQALTAYHAALPTEANPSTNFYFNFGTVALQAGKAGEASVLLWRSLFLAPFDGDTRANLQMALERTPGGARSVRPATWYGWWPSELRALPWQPWFLVALIGLVPALLAARAGKMPAPWAWSFLGLAGVCLFFSAVTLLQSRTPTGGIIAPAGVLSGPAKSFPPITTLEPGSLVSLEESREGWHKIRFYNPRSQETVGWVESAAILPLR